MRVPWPSLAPVLASASACAVALAIRPRTVDSAAHVFRAELFEREGVTLWSNAWYGGHHTVAYSLLFPPLAALLGPLVVGALEAVAATALFERVARRRWGAQAALWGSVWFGLGSSTFLFTGRLTFGLGVALGVASVVAELSGRRALAAVLAAACSLASPVAGLFLGIGAVAVFLAGERRRGLRLGVASVGPAVLVAYTFPEGGHEPFEPSTFWPLPLWLAGFVLVMPKRERVLRITAAVYLAAGVAWFLLETPMGGNAVRLGAIAGGPVLACAAAAAWPDSPRRRAALLAVMAGFALWQWSPAVRDTKKALEDPATQAAYYEPLTAELARRGAHLERTEIPFTRAHWEAAEVADRFLLARGWQRQLDIGRNPIFYAGGVLTAATYAAWLAENGVGYVALADAKPDYSAYRERALIERGLPYLRPVWESDHWRLFRVTIPHAMVVARGGAVMRLTEFDSDSFVLSVERPGSATVKVRWSHFWRARGGCVERDGEWTRVTTERPGRLRVAMAFSPVRVVSRGRRCA